MSTRANVFIRNDYDDREKEVIYHHCDGYPNHLGKILTNILQQFSLEKGSSKVSKKELAQFICDKDNDFRITTPYEAGDAEYNYEIYLSERRAYWEEVYSGNEDWLCDI